MQLVATCISTPDQGDVGRKMRILPKRGINKIRSGGSSSYLDCPHSREGGEMIVECHSCPGGHDLLNDTCFRSVLRVLSSGAKVDSLILSGNWELSYDGDCVRALCSLSSIVRFCQELSRTPTKFQDCIGCALSPERLFGQLVDRLPHLPDPDQLSCIRVPSAKHKSACEACVSRSRSKLVQIGLSIGQLDREISRTAFMVVEAGNGH